MQNPLLEQYGIRYVAVSLGLLSEKYLEQIDLIAKKWWGQWWTTFKKESHNWNVQKEIELDKHNDKICPRKRYKKRLKSIYLENLICTTLSLYF